MLHHHSSPQFNFPKKVEQKEEEIAQKPIYKPTTTTKSRKEWKAASHPWSSCLLLTIPFRSPSSAYSLFPLSHPILGSKSRRAPYIELVGCVFAVAPNANDRRLKIDGRRPQKQPDELVGCSCSGCKNGMEEKNRQPGIPPP
jgi:hypothetical protein